ncbi:MAG: cytochrome c peroxidase [Planctomycetota bacterium]|nr:cytochrome c peroxidase [Planctomycetota bacterium]
MKRLLSRIVPFALAAPLFLAGCGGSGKEDTATTGTAEKAQDQPAKGDIPGKSVTPDQVIDTNKVVDVVKGEVKGGESTKGPSRTDHLFAYPDAKLIKDEPLEIEPPRGLPPLAANVYVPASNPVTKGKVELGKQLYFEPRVSKNGTVSCATCHNPEKGWTDGLMTSTGIFGQKGGRNAPTVLNTVYGRSMFWDGRAPSLEGQSQGPPQNSIEMGEQSYEEIVDRLRAIPGYKEQFKNVFGTDVTLDGVAKAIATFERVTALSGGSAFDKYQNSEAPDHNKILSESQKRGLILFGLQLNGDDDYKTDAVRGKASCTKCHAGFNFTDEQFHNLGVGWDAKQGAFKDPGRWAVTAVGAKNTMELGSFKTPTCRDIAKTAPYMHDGSEPTLEAVIEYYDRGGNANATLDKDIKPLKLTKQEKADLVEFMKALTGTPIAVALPTLPPGPDGKTVDPKSALTPPSKSTAMDMHGLIVR